MPEQKNPRLFLDDIIESVDRIERYTKGISRDQFLKDIKTQDAVIRNLEIFGEAVKQLPESFTLQYPEVPWRLIAGMRDKLIHHYFGVSIDIVWETIQHDIPAIRPSLKKIQLSIEDKGH